MCVLHLHLCIATELGFGFGLQNKEKQNFATFHLFRGYMVKTESDALYCQRHPRHGLERLRDFDSALRSTKQYILVSNIEGGEGYGIDWGV